MKTPTKKELTDRMLKAERHVEGIKALVAAHLQKDPPPHDTGCEKGGCLLVDAINSTFN